MALVDQDQEHLRLLTVCYYVYAGIVALFACIPIIHLTFGVLLIANPGWFGDGKNAPPPAFVGYLVAIIAGLIVLAGWTFAACSFLTGRFLARRKHYLFCLIVSGANCMFAPFGTALGVFTIIVLLRPEVKSMFVSPPPLPIQNSVPQSS